MTTTLVARAGFIALWVILISCLFKVTIQLEFGKYGISSGKTTLQAFNELPGPRWRGISWSIWSWVVLASLSTALLVYKGNYRQVERTATLVGVALAAFGLTGVSADEIISYPYWCQEKGYARFTGVYQKDHAWEIRAKGWIRVMYLDGILSMIIYTLAIGGVGVYTAYSLLS